MNMSNNFNTNIMAASIQESVKVTEIKDDFGITRYKVTLVEINDTRNFPQSELFNNLQKIYEVKVIKVSHCIEEQLVLADQQFELFSLAEEFFNQNVQKYLDAVKLLSKHYQDIDVYADRIYYRLADCCATCQFAKANPNRISKKQFLCTNNDLFYNNPDIQTGKITPIYPFVDACGICKNFRRYDKNAEVH